MASEAQDKWIEINHADGLSSIQQFSAALDEALLGGHAVRIRLHLSTKTKAIGFREKIIASNTLKGMLELLGPCLEANPNLRIERIEV